MAAAPATTAVSIVSPRDGAEVTSSELVLQMVVHLPEGATLLGVRALIDGRLAAQVRGLRMTAKPADDNDRLVSQSITVTLPAADCTLSVLAETTKDKSPPVSIKLRWRGAPVSPEQIAAFQPKLYVLSIGVSEYQQPDLRLRFAAKDARDLASTFMAQQKILYRATEVRVLTDQNATRNNILDGLEWLQRQTTAKDVAVLFLAGHGITDPTTGSYLFLPYEADPEAIKRTMLPSQTSAGRSQRFQGRCCCSSIPVILGRSLAAVRRGDWIISARSSASWPAWTAALSSSPRPPAGRPRRRPQPGTTARSPRH